LLNEKLFNKGKAAIGKMAKSALDIIHRVFFFMKVSDMWLF